MEILSAEFCVRMTKWIHKFDYISVIMQEFGIRFGTTVSTDSALYANDNAWFFVGVPNASRLVQLLEKGEEKSRSKQQEPH